MRIGPKALTRGISAEIACIIPAIDRVFAKQNITPTLTSGTDRTHSRGSLHYIGNAIDIWWADMESTEGRRLEWIVYEEINGFPKSAAIPPDYDVIFEGDHIHVEYQPKVEAAEYQKLVASYLAGE